MIQARMHANSAQHRRVVNAAKRVTERCLKESVRPSVSWSGGKDSVHGDAIVWVRRNGNVFRTTPSSLEDSVRWRSTVDQDGRVTMRPLEPLDVLTASSDCQRAAVAQFYPLEYMMAHEACGALYEITLHGGYTIRTTGAHSVMVARNAADGHRAFPQEVSQLQVGDELLTANDLSFECPDDCATPDWLLRLGGLWLADGCYAADRKLVIAAGGNQNVINFLSTIPRSRTMVEKAIAALAEERPRHDTMIAAINAVQRRLGCTFSTSWNAAYKKHHVKRLNDTVRVRIVPGKGDAWICDKALVVRMQNLGFVGTAHHKRVPDWVFGLSRRQIGILLSGYFDGDGCLTRGRIEASSISSCLIHGVRDLLLRLGVPSTIHYRSSIGGFRSRASGIYILSAASESAHNNFRRWVPTWKVLANRQPSQVGKRKRAYGFSTNAVKQIRRVDAARVFDFEVAERHTFLADNVLVHNSTAMSHLVLSVDPTVTLVSEKDDLDYPGEEAYIDELATRWNAKLEILRPDVSPSQWISENLEKIAIGDDFHSRAAGLSKACFYDVMTRDDAKRDLVFLGLRAEESVHRLKNRTVNGLDYRRKNGLRICAPLGDWTGLDVFAYLFAHEIEPLHVYRCIGFMHQREPWRIRKSWWIPGDQGKYGGVTWLRRYYPSLFQRLLEWFPRARSFG